MNYCLHKYREQKQKLVQWFIFFTVSGYTLNQCNGSIPFKAATKNFSQNSYGDQNIHNYRNSLYMSCDHISAACDFLFSYYLVRIY